MLSAKVIVTGICGIVTIAAMHFNYPVVVGAMVVLMFLVTA